MWPDALPIPLMLGEYAPGVYAVNPPDNSTTTTAPQIVYVKCRCWCCWLVLLMFILWLLERDKR